MATTTTCGAADVTRLLITAGVLLALVASLAGNLTQWRNHAVELERIAGEHKTAVEAANAAAQESARKTELAQAVAVTAVAEAYEKGKHDAQATADRVAADLRNGNIQLRDRWQSCAAGRVSDADATAAELDAARRDREESASRIVLAAAAADNQIAQLQAFIRTERAPAPWATGVPR